MLVKKAAALVNRELGLLPVDKAEAIVRAADEVLGGAHREQFRVDPFQAGAGTSHNMNANEVLANRANELLGGGPRGVYAPVHPNDDVNRGQSSNDTIPTAIRIALQRPAAELAAALLALQEALEAKARRVRSHPEERPHAPAGRRAHPPRSGVRRLRGHGAQGARSASSGRSKRRAPSTSAAPPPAPA